MLSAAYESCESAQMRRSEVWEKGKGHRARFRMIVKIMFALSGAHTRSSGHGFFWGWGFYKAGTQLAIGRFMWRRWKATIIGSWAHSRPNHHWPLLLTWLSALCPSPRETKLKVQAAFKHDYELGQHVVSSSICPIGDAMFNYARPGISQMRLAPKRPCCWVERGLKGV